MAQASNLVLYTAEYDDVTAALADLDAIERLHDDEMIGSYDAAVIDKQNGKPHIAKRIDRPLIRAVPEALGHGELPGSPCVELIPADMGCAVSRTIRASTLQGPPGSGALSTAWPAGRPSALAPCSGRRWPPVTTDPSAPAPSLSGRKRRTE